MEGKERPVAPSSSPSRGRRGSNPPRAREMRTPATHDDTHREGIVWPLSAPSPTPQSPSPPSSTLEPFALSSSSPSSSTSRQGCKMDEDIELAVLDVQEPAPEQGAMKHRNFLVRGKSPLSRGDLYSPTWAWATPSVDRFLCHLDIRDFTFQEMVELIKSKFPHLEGKTIDVSRVESRLMVLDGRPQCNYFREAIDEAISIGADEYLSESVIQTFSASPSGGSIRKVAKARSASTSTDANHGNRSASTEQQITESKKALPADDQQKAHPVPRVAEPEEDNTLISEWSPTTGQLDLTRAEKHAIAIGHSKTSTTSIPVKKLQDPVDQPSKIDAQNANNVSEVRQSLSAGFLHGRAVQRSAFPPRVESLRKLPTLHLTVTGPTTGPLTSTESQVGQSSNGARHGEAIQAGSSAPRTLSKASRLLQKEISQNTINPRAAGKPGPLRVMNSNSNDNLTMTTISGDDDSKGPKENNHPKGVASPSSDGVSSSKQPGTTGIVKMTPVADSAEQNPDASPESRGKQRAITPMKTSAQIGSGIPIPKARQHTSMAVADHVKKYNAGIVEAKRAKQEEGSLEMATSRSDIKGKGRADFCPSAVPESSTPVSKSSIPLAVAKRSPSWQSTGPALRTPGGSPVRIRPRRRFGQPSVESNETPAAAKTSETNEEEYPPGTAL